MSMARIEFGEFDNATAHAVSEGVTFNEVFGEGPWYAHLTRVSKRLARLQPEMGVVAAQMAVEVFVEDAVRLLLERQGLSAPVSEAVLGCLPDRSLMDRRTRDLWSALADQPISSAPEWKAYHQHIELRNRVVHGGARVEVEQARRSLEVCLGLIHHMQKALGTYNPFPRCVLADEHGVLLVRFGHVEASELPDGWSAINALDEEIGEQFGVAPSAVLAERMRQATVRPVGTRVAPDEPVLPDERHADEH
jgi:hypothetical protein